jgi:hypothetical protein
MYAPVIKKERDKWLWLAWNQRRWRLKIFLTTCGWTGFGFRLINLAACPKRLLNIKPFSCEDVVWGITKGSSSWRHSMELGAISKFESCMHSPKKFSECYRIRYFTVLLITDHHWAIHGISWANSTPSQIIWFPFTSCSTWRFHLITFSH